MRDGFLLDPEVVHLNHGSFGACPEPVFEEYQRLQRELEAGPTDFFTRRVARWFWGGGEKSGRLAEARALLAAFVGARTEDLVFVPNATSGLNAVIRSLRLDPEDEVLTTRHEYGAITRTWEFVGATLVVCEPEELVERIGPRTRAVSVSHITSPTALLLPVEEICAAAREAGALAIVDGAHAPGQVSLDLESRAVELPPGDPDELWGRLYEELRVEVPVYEWEGRRVLRVSIGPYNDEADLDRLIAALEQLL